MRLGGKLVIGHETNGLNHGGHRGHRGKLSTTEDRGTQGKAFTTEDTEERSLRFAGRTKASVPT